MTTGKVVAFVSYFSKLERTVKNVVLSYSS